MTDIKTIGLTGGIACGKSSVSKLLAQNGIEVINADELAHQTITLNGPAYEEVLKEFGRRILKQSGEIDRRKLGAIIFADPKARKRLESIIHPVVRTDIMRAIAEAKTKGFSCLVVEIQLLFEVGWECLFDRIWVVSSSIEKQVTRLQKRDQLTEEMARTRIAAQLPLAYKEERADVVIYNDEGLLELANQVQQVIKSELIQ
ncbi:MAG TPA: dephospho-CoA kinase [Firmicutes bacterium]|nr:dephospho-CoA kinase [Bacillota bacterium]